MKKSTKIIISIIVVALIIWGGFKLFKKPEPVSVEPIKIGALLPLSGDAAAWGENAKDATDLAVEEVNEAGGINNQSVEILYEDTAGEAKKAVSAYQKLVKINKVDAIFGPLLQTGVASIAPLIVEDDIPVVTPSYVPMQNRPTPRNPLTIWMDPTIESGKMAEYAFQEGTRKVAVIGTLDSWENEVSEGFAKKFESLGGEVVVKEIVQPDIGEMRPSVTRAVSKNPDAIFLGTYFQFVRSLKVLKDLNYEGKIYSIEVDSYLADQTKGLSDGLEFIAPDFYTPEFIDKFEAKYGSKPGIPSGQAYDAMNVLLSLLEENKTRDDVLKAMSKFESYDGASGLIRIDEDNRTFMPTAIFEVQSGEISRMFEF